MSFGKPQTNDRKSPLTKLSELVTENKSSNETKHNFNGLKFAGKLETAALSSPKWNEMIKNSPTKETMLTQTKKAIISRFKSDTKAVHSKSPTKSLQKTAMSNQAKTEPMKIRQ